MKNQDNLVWSTLLFFVGSIVTMFGFDLHSSYGYRQSYETALHWHIGAGLVILVGVVVAAAGLIGVVTALVSRNK